MAEAFGLAAGVLQVAGFGAEVSSTLFKCAKKIHNASKELEEIASQVETTSISLRRVDALLKDPTTKALHTQKLYDDTNTVSNGCFEVFHELDNYVKSFDSKPGFAKMAFRSKVLRRYSDVLHLMISVMAIVEGRRAATKDELQALEADLKLLALSNKDLSHSNKTLTDTIAAISRAPISPVAPKARRPPIVSPVTYGHGTSGAMPVTMLFAMPSVKLPPISPRNQHPSDQMTDHLQRCMKSVQELALTISCALNTLQGREKIGSSDVHGSYEKLSLAMAQVPTHVQCDQCKQRVAWSHFEPARSGVGESGACKCRSQTPPQSCDSSSRWSAVRSQQLPCTEISDQRSQPLASSPESEAEQELIHPAATVSGAQARQGAQMSDTRSSPTIPKSSHVPYCAPRPSSSRRQLQLSPQATGKVEAHAHNTREPLSPSLQRSPSRCSFRDDQETNPITPPHKPAQDGGEKDRFSSDNKPTELSSEPGPFKAAYGSDPTFTPDQSQFPGPILSEIATSLMARPSGMQQSEPRQGGRKRNSRLSQEAKNRSSKMRKRRPKFLESHQGRRMRDYYDDLGGNQQRRQEQNKERHPKPDNVEHLNIVGGGSPDGESFDLDLDLADSSGENPPDSKSIYWKKPGGPEDATYESANPLVRVGGIESLRNPYPSSPFYLQHMYASSPNYQASQEWPTQRPVSPGAHQAELADLEAESKKRLLKVQGDQDSWAHPQARRALPSDESSAIQNSHSVEEWENIKIALREHMMQPAPPEPDQPARSTPLKAKDDSGPFVEGEFGLNIEIADVGAGGGDALDNFDFDSFLNVDDNGMGFDFPEVDGGLKDDVVGSVLDHSSHTQTDTEIAPQHNQKRSHSDAFPGSPEDTPISQRRKRRAASPSPRTGGVRESSVEAVKTAELPTDRSNSGTSTDSLLGVEALLQRWFDASAAAVLLRPSEAF